MIITKDYPESPNPCDDKVFVVLRENFSENDLDELACEFAESILYILEKQYSDDDRPRKAIQAKRDFIKGKITKEELEAVLNAVWDELEKMEY